jgi:ABC-2 type transport system permease protein
VRLNALLRKTMIENFRDWKMLVMTLSFAPFFVVLMYFYFEDATTSYRIAVVNQDEGAVAQGLIKRLEEVESGEGTFVLRVTEEEDLAAAQELIRDRSADLVIVIPDGFSNALLQYSRGSEAAPLVVRTYGDAANVKYMMAAAFGDYLTYEYAALITGETGPMVLEPVSLGRADAPDEFDLYVPGLLALALMMLMFTAAGTVIKEKDKGTLLRLRISNMSTAEWLAAVSITQVTVGLLAVALTYLTAWSLGYRMSGSLFDVAVVTILSSMAIVGISMIVAASLRTIFDLVTIGTFPFFILMFFSGGMFPLPDVQLFAVGARTINANDVLPTTHSIAAYDRIMNTGAGLGDVGFELAAIVLLSVVFFAIGTWAFTRRHMVAR